jgi:hypothetical protein
VVHNCTPTLDELDKTDKKGYASSELLSDTYRATRTDDASDLFELRKGMEVDKNGMVKSGLSHFSDEVDLPNAKDWYGLEKGTKAPEGLQWTYKWNENFGAWHVGLDPVGGPKTMSLETYNNLVNELRNSYLRMSI